MQYLLTAEEYETLVTDKRDLALALNYKAPKDHLAALGEACKRIACTMILETGNPRSVGGNPIPYGCIHVNRRDSYGYCDKCPVRDICPLSKDFSK